MNNNESDKYVMFSTLCGVLLTISELLPYIKNIKSNGIMQFITETCFTLLKKSKPHNDGANDVNARLLENFVDERFNRSDNLPYIDSVSKGEEENMRSNSVINTNKCIKILADNITITFNSPQEVKIT
jgi:hypothetical protein